MKKTTLNPLTDAPKSMTEITKDFMLAYMKSAKATPEDKAWFKMIVADNKQEKTNQLTSTKVNSANWKVIKRAFAERFFPNILVKGSDFFAELERL